MCGDGAGVTGWQKRCIIFFDERGEKQKKGICRDVGRGRFVRDGSTSEGAGV